MDIGISIVVTFLLVLVNGYFSMSEMALVNAKHVLLQKDADEGDKKAQRALGLASDSGQFLATIQVAITLVGFFASAAAATNLSDPLAQWLSGFGVGGGTLLLVYMTTLAGLDQHLAQGINLLYFLPAGLTALPAHLKNGYVEKGLLFPAISAGLLCAALASWAATALDVDLLRKLFGGFLILIGLSELFGRVKEET